jgi:predicted  nucleic acid-binding Zn-ribbon protein
MEEIEPLDVTLADLRARHEAALRSVESATLALSTAEAAIDEELASVTRDRAAAVAQVPSALVERYAKLRTRLGGIAVARLEGARCMGCRLELPRAELEEVRREPPDALVTCPQCTRLLVR